MDNLIPRGTSKVVPGPTEAFLRSSARRKGSRSTTVGLSELVPSKIEGPVVEAEEEGKGGSDKPAPGANGASGWTGSDGKRRELDEFDQEVQVTSKGVEVEQ